MFDRFYSLIVLYAFILVLSTDFRVFFCFSLEKDITALPKILFLLVMEKGKKGVKKRRSTKLGGRFYFNFSVSLRTWVPSVGLSPAFDESIFLFISVLHGNDEGEAKLAVLGGAFFIIRRA